MPTLPLTPASSVRLYSKRGFELGQSCNLQRRRSDFTVHEAVMFAASCSIDVFYVLTCFGMVPIIPTSRVESISFRVFARECVALFHLMLSCPLLFESFMEP